MTEHHAVVADPHRLVAFHLASDFRRRLATGARWADPGGTDWLAVSAPVPDGTLVWVGVEGTDAPSSGPDGLRIGAHLWRLLWALHVAVRAQRRPLLRLNARWLGAMVWGGDRGRWPRHWRGDLQTLLTTARRLHAAETLPGERPAFGACTQLLYGGAAGDADRDRVDVEIAPAFLGSLEGLYRKNDNSEPSYVFYSTSRRRAKGQIDLGTIGRDGRVQTVFVPSLLADPHAGLQLPVHLQRLLQSVLRQLTLGVVEDKKRGTTLGSEPQVVVGARVPNYGGRDFFTCPILNRERLHVGFNGNRKRRGLGYRLDTPGGWLAQCGYELTDLRGFLTDVKHLGEKLGIVAVGIRGEEATGLEQLVAWADADRLHKLEGVHLRLYAEVGYEERWAQAFAMPTADTAPGPTPSNGVNELRDRLNVRRVSVRQLAAGVGVSAAHISRVLNGQKAPTAELMAKMTAAVETLPPGRRPKSCGDGPTTPVGWAVHHYARGWVTIPSLPGKKRPAVKWKQYQEHKPPESEVIGLFDGRPDAGLMLVLGPVSGVFVIDVDGAEAEQTLVERLGGIPKAPRSGRGDPHRFHLFFRYPVGVPARAKYTPWHPKLEFRGHGGLVVLPPSLHPSGSRYEWAPGASPDDLPLPEVPASVLETLLAAPTHAKGPVIVHKFEPLDVPADLDASPTTREFLTGQYAHADNWNNRLYLAACDLCGRGVPLNKALPLLLAGADPIGPADEDIARRTVESAYSRPRVPGTR